ncbi:iron complex outermembrane receptor protein [Pedobacter africanus]|uniref:Iron complex outermembrane receptor protein n=1 Tax=Pedobacter africanus TaxID=151894 RepID=A0ACC6KR02_9SPHI|nr:TonB-dependent receptor [Pedobacter africanus]MDR6781749.1 iron complex outermembrane receptor protein [Pedobacter africanus]
MLFLQANAQKQVVNGHIYDSQTRQPLAGVILFNMDALQLGKSDSKGFFEIAALQPDNKFTAVLPGYKTQLVKISGPENELNIQLEADGLSLNEVRVAGYNENKTNKETAGSIALITARDINRGNAVSLQPALNAIPGVRMDQSTLSEARISIRGNGVRAAYGIRSVKIYVNEIPVTEADGTTRIEALDVNSIGRAEVIKGPASSIYGAGTAGVINFQLQRAPYQEQSLEASGLFGAYGLHRLASTYRSGGNKVNSYVSYGWQEYDGYRKHSNDMRRFLTGNFQLFPSDKRIITLMLNRTTQHSQIPGSLTADQIAADPLQANATNLDKAAGRYQTWTRIGLGQQYRFNDRFSNSTSVFTYFYDLDHPLPYAYIRNFYQSYGGRTRFSYAPGFTMLPTRFTIGAEFNEGLTKGSQYVNNQGKEGTINSNIDYRNRQYSLFYQSETNLGPQTTLILGLSYNSMRYAVNDYLKQQQSGIKKFDPQATPRIALSHTFSDALSLHASVSSGFSPPSSSEIKNVDGTINPKLQAEKAMNYELNAKGNVLQSRLAYDLAVFKMEMKGELIAQSVQQGITVYNNAGKTSHNGVELALSYQALKAGDGAEIVSLRPFAALTYSDFKFKDYQTLNAQGQSTATYDGNKLTGIAPWVLNAGIDLETKTGIYFYGNYFYSDRLPLNDGNLAYNPAYQVLNAKLGYRKQVLKCLELNAYAGLDNILDENYSSIVSLNAVGYGGAQPAYFNPSPKRNGYGGLNIKYLF